MMYQEIRQWYAVKTRFKCEKSVAHRLRAKSLDCYVPLVEKTRLYTRKVKRYEIPLISCYVFVHIHAQEYIRVLETPNVIDLVRFGGAPVPVAENELETLRRFCGEQYDIRIEELDFEEGEEVEIQYGQLAGIQGKLIQLFNKNEFVVQLQTIGFQLRVLIDKQLLKKLPVQASVA